MKLISEFFKKHFFFLFIFTNYFVALVLFGEFTLFYIDKFDNEIVYSKILGDFYKGNTQAAEIFLNGELKINWFRRLFQPFSLIYVFNFEYAFWIIDILNKIISYFCFYILSKKITKNAFTISLCSFFFASLNDDSVHGFLIAVFPYFCYLILFKNKIDKKHLFIIFFCGLNSELIYGPYFIIFLFCILICFKKLSFLNIKRIVVLSFIFYFFLILSNLNIIYSLLFEGPFHRVENVFLFTNFYLTDFLKSFLSLNIFKQEKFFSYSLAYNIHLFFFKFFFFSAILFCKERIAKRIFFVWFVVSFFFYALLSVKLDIFKYVSPTYIIFYECFIFSIMALIFINNRKFLTYILIFICLISEINSSLIPFSKNYIKYFKEDNYRNYYTFSGYYLKSVYSEIKNIVRNEKTISLWPADPMVAVMNGIKTIDGEFNLYPLTYKKKFYKIIKDELENNLDFKKYYLENGHRVYAYVSDPKNIKINFNEAKKIGAKYVISKYVVNNNGLKKIFEIKDKETIYLYEIK